MMTRALLFRLGGLGDLLVALPSIHFIRKKFPDWRLLLVCREEYGTLLRETGVVEEILSFESRRLAGIFSGDMSSTAELDIWLRSFDFVLGWMLGGQGGAELEEFFRSLGGCRCRIIIYESIQDRSISQFFFQRTSEFLTGRITPDISFEECALLPVGPSLKKEGLSLVAREGEKIAEKFIAVHPGSGSQQKCWPLENYLEMIRRLSSAGVAGALITGEPDAQIAGALQNISLPPAWIWLDQPPLDKLAGLLAGVALYLGNDSGVTHLAAACGADVIALFREDLEMPWSPYGKTYVLSAESLEKISFDVVWESVSSFLGIP